MLTVLGDIAQFEREMMLERQREGVIKAKAAGRYKGQKPIPEAIRQEVIRLAGKRMTKTAIAEKQKTMRGRKAMRKVGNLVRNFGPVDHCIRTFGQVLAPC